MSFTLFDPSQINGILKLTGGTLTGILNMGSNKITNLANGTVSTDAINLSQLTANGTVNSGTQYQMAYYAATGTAVSGDSRLTTDSTGLLTITPSTDMQSYIIMQDHASIAKEFISGYTTSGQSGLRISTNRDPITGTYSNTGFGSALITLTAQSGFGAVEIWGSDTNNVSPIVLAHFESTGVSILGTTTNNNASAGNVGEFVESSASGNFPATGITGDATSISLTAGDWDISLAFSNPNAGTASTSYALMGISTHSGNSQTGLGVLPSTMYWVPQIGVETSVTIARFRASISGTTTYYAKMFNNAYTGTAPTYRCTLNARRMR